MRKAYMNWSSGKDSAMALHAIQRSNELQLDRLFTTINSSTDRVSMHGLKRDLLHKQAECLGLPLDLLELPALPDMDTYNQLMHVRVSSLKSQGYHDCVCGDIFLEDLRDYRIQQLQRVEREAHFPLWQKDTKALMNQFLQDGFRAVVVAANDKWFDQSFVGSELGQELLNQLPEEVDPCGENGEFHTFCFDGPIFKQPVSFQIGEKVMQKYPAPAEGEKEVGFWFCDLIA